MRKTGRTAINKKDAIICVLIIAFTVTFIWNFRFVRVVGESMESTLSDGQWLLTTTHTSDLSRNDIVVFRYEDRQCVKRVMAVGGDTVLLQDGKIYINQVAYNDYVYDGEPKSYTLSENELFVLGDNTRNSLDSRTYGPIKREQIQFKYLFALL